MTFVSVLSEAYRNEWLLKFHLVTGEVLNNVSVTGPVSRHDQLVTCKVSGTPGYVALRHIVRVLAA